MKILINGRIIKRSSMDEYEAIALKVREAIKRTHGISIVQQVTRDICYITNRHYPPTIHNSY